MINFLIIIQERIMANIVACRTYNLKLDEDEFAK